MRGATSGGQARKKKVARVILSATIEVLDGAQPDSERIGGRRLIGRRAPGRPRAAVRKVMIEHLSPTGCRFVSTMPLSIGSQIRFDVIGAGTTTGSVVRRDGDEHRCEFQVPLTPAQVALALESALTRTMSAQSHDDRWPRSVRAVLFIGGGVAAWAAVVGLIKAVSSAV